MFLATSLSEDGIILILTSSLEIYFMTSMKNAQEKEGILGQEEKQVKGVGGVGEREVT